MARSKSNHPVAIIRCATGKTAKQFAAHVGISESLVKQLECGSRKLTEDAARLLSKATGADTKALLKGQAKTADGKAFTSKSFRGHIKNMAGPHWTSGSILSWIELVMDVVANSKHRDRFYRDLVEFIGKAVRDCRLQSEIDNELKVIPREIHKEVFGEVISAYPQLAKYSDLFQTKCIEDLATLESVTLKIPLGDYPRLWSEDMATPPPPRDGSLFNQL